MLSTNDILQILPHKHPYLLIDRIIELQEGERAVGLKAVSYAEGVFAGHFPEDPVLPGALIVEASSQVAGFIVYSNGKLFGYMVEIKAFRFHKPAKPGCLLRIEAQKTKKRSLFLEVDITVKANEEHIASGTLVMFINKNTPISKMQTQQAGSHDTH
ncbi:MAG: 3-hydroxyacyl-ACP dehydratase FabZ [Desulfobacteraceae bacterium]|jgi:3-hydroxyacyl-[acyl-carrier-protein] dehydratase